MTRRYDLNPAAAVLWASAFVIAALVIVQAGRIHQNTAHAEMATSSGGFSMLTTNSGTGGETEPNEVLFILDDRGNMLYVYEVEDARRGIQLRSGGPLTNLFNNAR